MDTESNRPLTEEAEPTSPSTRPRFSIPIIVAAFALILVAGVAAWLLWPRQSGKPVPAPRSVSFGESSTPQTALSLSKIGVQNLNDMICKLN